MLHCLRCGSNAFSSSNGNKYLCESCDFTFYLNASGGAAVILKDTLGNYLWMIRGRDPYEGYLDTAGGFIDPGEAADEAARRECREELGIELNELTYLGSFPGQYERCEITRPIINIVFEATLTLDQIAKISLSNEITGIESYTLETLPRDRLAKNIEGIQTLLFPRH